MTLREQVARAMCQQLGMDPDDTDNMSGLLRWKIEAPLADIAIALITEACADAVWPIYPPGFDHDNESIEVAAAKDVLALKIEERIRNLAKEITND